MNKITDRVSEVGARRIAFASLIVSCIVVLLGFGWQYLSANSKQEQQNETTQKQIAEVIYAATASHIEALTSHLTSISKSPHLAALMKRADKKQIEKEQNQLVHQFPSASKVCLIAASVDEADESSACTPITFATLDSLRQAKKEGSAPIGVMQPGSDNAHLLLAQRITAEDDEVVGVLLVVFKLDFISKLLVDEYGKSGYVELQQGKKVKSAVLKVGDEGLKKVGEEAFFQQDFSQSYWNLAYWPTKGEKISFPIVIYALVVVVILLLWVVGEMFQREFVRHDVSTLREQLEDLQAGVFKAEYPLAFEAFRDVIDDIQVIGRDNKQSQQNSPQSEPEPIKKVTAESISLKLAETQNKVVESEGEEYSHEVAVIDKAIFKAYDIRGIVGDLLDEDVIKTIGVGIGSEAIAQGQNRLVVGRDGRLSSDSLAEALIEGLLSTGCEVLDIGQVPTPIMYFACEHLETYSGVMVTGSHNPAEYNGLKIVLAGKTVADEDLQKLSKRIDDGNFESGQGTRSNVSVVDDYIARITEDVNVTRSISVVVDCGNGVAGKVIPQLLTSLGCNVTELYCDVDGSFPNHPPNPSDPNNLQDLITAVQANEAELGLAFDGDGDRLIVVDANGQPIWPDRLMSMFAQDVLSREPGAVIIYDVKSSNLLGEAILRAGGEALMWQSGHSRIKNKMLETGAQLAGEMSGHIFFKERWYGFDDGLYTACRLLELLSADPLERTPTGVFAALPNRVNTPEIFIEMDDTESRQFIDQFVAEGQFEEAQITTIDGLRADYPNGWGVVRASNTMPGITLRFEADTDEALLTIQEQFKQKMLQIKPTLNLSF